jgi:hypothetical protein
MKRKPAAVLSVFLLGLCIYAWGDRETSLFPSKGTRRDVVRRTARLVRETYVYPDKGKAIHDGLLGWLKEGFFDKEEDEGKFAARLSNGLYRLSGDKHMRVIFDPRLARDLEKWDRLGDKERQRIERERIRRAARENFGFRKLEILEGNVGYLDLRIFDKSDPALETGAAAMKFLSHADSIILDLRSNRGGHPQMVRMIAGCFIKGRIRLNTILDRDGNVREEIWTPPDGEGPDLQDRDLYILTGPRTASAAESFTYMMKGLKRAVIVGTRTAGAANPGGFRHAGDGFLVFIPTGRPVSPFSGDNWEGRGIVPDLEVPEAGALEKAHALARGRRPSALEERPGPGLDAANLIQ